MKKVIKAFLVMITIFFGENISQSNAMNEKISQHLLRIRQYRPDLTDTINSVVLFNNSKYENKSKNRLELPQLNVVVEERGSTIEKIIKGDKLFELQQFLRENDIKGLNTITTEFMGLKKMKIPLIQYCVIEKAIQCFKYLLINGIDDATRLMEYHCLEKFLTGERKYEWDCMATAIYLGNMEIVKILEEKGIEKAGFPGHVDAAILSYRNGIAKEIIKNTQDPTTLRYALNVGLFASAQSNNIAAFEWLSKKCTAINVKNIFGYTALHRAAQYNSKEICEILISKGADINAPSMYVGTPLHFAVRNNSKEIVELLISLGVDVNARDYDGWTPLHIAVQCNDDRKDIFDFLISKGADIDARTFSGTAPLHFAADNDSRYMGEILISKGADIDAHDVNYNLNFG